MYLAVELVMNQNAGVWNQVPVISDIVDEFTACISEIENTRMLQESDRSGFTVDKQNARAAAERLTIEVSGALVAYAERNGNQGLKRLVKQTQSGLAGLRDTTAESQMRIVHTEAFRHQAGLAMYGVSAADLNSLLAAINAYKNLIGVTRESTSLEHTGTSRLETLFATGDSILKDQLDPMMEGMKNSTPLFFEEYKSARLIVDNRGRGGSNETGNMDLPPVE